MAAKTTKTTETTTKELQFMKIQLVSSKKYERYRDFLQGNLDDSQMYTFAEVDALIEKYYGKGLGE